MSNKFFIDNESINLIVNDIVIKITNDITNNIIDTQEKTVIYKIINYINTYNLKSLTVIQKHYICIEVVIKLVNSYPNTDAIKLLALSSFPLKIFEYFAEIEEASTMDSEAPTMDSFNIIINELYTLICDTIKFEKLTPQGISNNLFNFNIINKIIKVLGKYEKLSWEDKKTVIIKAFDKIKENIKTIFPNISENDINIVKLAFSTIPSIIDLSVTKCNQIFEEVISNPVISGFANIMFSLMKTSSNSQNPSTTPNTPNEK
jgi:hypothetical protein